VGELLLHNQQKVFAAQHNCYGLQVLTRLHPAVRTAVNFWRPVLPPCPCLCVCCALSGLAYKTHAGATKGPAPPDFEIRTQDQLESACYDQPGLCLITLVDGRSSAANKHRCARLHLPSHGPTWGEDGVVQQRL
jgi:hypothetical protein